MTAELEEDVAQLLSVAWLKEPSIHPFPNAGQGTDSARDDGYPNCLSLIHNLAVRLGK